jgi:hypothetical protein
VAFRPDESNKGMHQLLYRLNGKVSPLLQGRSSRPVADPESVQNRQQSLWEELHLQSAYVTCSTSPNDNLIYMGKKS